MRVQNALKFLVGYPYGCVEQTVSRLMPLYLMRQESELVGSVLEDGRNYEAYLKAGIERILAMQTASGGIGFWPGSDTPYQYGSVYALHFLNLVNEDNEFDIPEPAINALRRYVRGIASNWNQTGTSDLYLRAYAIYALSLGGDLGALLQIDRFASLPIPETSRHLLAAALAEHTNDADRVAMFRNGPVQKYSTRETDGNLNSEMRNAAIELMAMRALNASDNELAAQANTLIAYLEGKPRSTTQEMAFIVSALGQYLGDLAENLDTASGTVTGPEGEASIAGRDFYNESYEGPGGEFTVENTGQTPLFVSLSLGGVPLQPNTEAYAEGIQLERRYYTSDGAEHKGASFTQGETYVVELRFETQTNRQHVVVADRLPAGCEIENPRLDPTALPPGQFEEGLDASHLEIRDDRLVAVFETLPEGETTFYYALRAVTPGEYNQPPATTECMYAPEIRGGTAPADITVE